MFAILFFKRCYNSVVMYDVPWWCFCSSISKVFYCSPEFVNITNFWFNTSVVSVNCVVVYCVLIFSIVISVAFWCIFILYCEFVRVVLCFGISNRVVVNISSVSENSPVIFRVCSFSNIMQFIFILCYLCKCRSVPFAMFLVYCILLDGAMVSMHVSTSLIMISAIVLGLSVLKTWSMLLVIFK